MKRLDELHQQLERHKSSLKSVDESIKKLDSNEQSYKHSEASSNRIVKLNYSKTSNDRPSYESNDRNSLLKRKNNDRSDYSNKRSSRDHYKSNDPESDDDTLKKPTIQSSVVSSNMPIKSKEDLIKIQNKYNGAQQRNKRILGVILGTLKEFKSDDKERSSTSQAIHRKELEKKIEIKKVEEKNKIIEDKKKLEQEKYRQLRNIEIVEQKIKLTEDLELWKKHQIELKKFIRSKAKPNIFYIPKVMNVATSKLLAETCANIEEGILKKNKEVDIEIEILNKEASLLNKEPEEHEDNDTNNKSIEDKENDKSEKNNLDSDLEEDKDNINVNIGEEDQENLVEEVNLDKNVNEEKQVKQEEGVEDWNAAKRKKH